MTTNAKIILVLTVLFVGVGIFLFAQNYSKQNGDLLTPNIATTTPITSTTTPTVITNPDPTPAPTPTPDPEPEPEPSPQPSPVSSVEINRLPGNSKRVTFTFDGGSGVQSADEIIAVLKKHNLESTFFLTGKWASANPNYVRLFHDEGHEVFNHTYNHPDLTTLSESEIKEEFARTESAIKSITGVTTKPYFRPPYGARNKFVRDTAAGAGYQSIYWTVDAFDWREGWTEEMVKKRILDTLAPGNIIMMHIGDDITGNILDEVLTEIKARGYEIVPLSEGLK